MRKLNIEEVGNDSLLHEHKEEMQIHFHKSMDLLTSCILNNIFLCTECTENQCFHFLV